MRPTTAPTTTPSAAPTATEDERTRFERKVDRLSDLSEAHPHDAYEDVPWDEPGFELDPTDPRLRLFSFDPLARTRWYHQLEPIEQARIGLRRQGVNLRIGWEFENYLQQGLLARAQRMSNTDVTFRYSQYEIAEESHHSMMFYEFVRRYSPEVRGMPGALKALTNPTVQLACRRYPALFFFLVLGGEIPIDYVQRLVLKEQQVHPLLERIMRIHVEEEARHVDFANLELRRLVPRMTERGRRVLARLVPEVLGIEARLMLYPSPWQIRYDRIPPAQLKAAYRHPETHRLRTESVARIRKLCHDLGLMTPEAQRHWERVGLWAEPTRRRAAGTSANSTRAAA